MKKTAIAIFSISLTAGTLYLSYSQIKAYLIKKLVTSWEAEANAKSKALSADQVKHLKEELDKLFIWEVHWLSTYWSKARSNATEKELQPYIKKIKDKKIREKVDLRSVDSLVFGT